MPWHAHLSAAKNPPTTLMYAWPLVHSATNVIDRFFASDPHSLGARRIRVMLRTLRRVHVHTRARRGLVSKLSSLRIELGFSTILYAYHSCPANRPPTKISLFQSGLFFFKSTKRAEPTSTVPQCFSGVAATSPLVCALQHEPSCGLRYDKIAMQPPVESVSK